MNYTKTSCKTYHCFYRENLINLLSNFSHFNALMQKIIKQEQDTIDLKISLSFIYKTYIFVYTHIM